jgi:hypothetical protein
MRSTPFILVLLCASIAHAQAPAEPDDDMAIEPPEPGDPAAEPAPAPSEPAPAEPAPAEPTRAQPAPAATSTAEPAPASRSREPETVAVTVPARSRARSDEEEEEKDEGDHFDFLWIELSGGAAYVDLRAINADNFYPEFVRLSGYGPAGSLGLGFRIEFVSVGVRAALAHYDASDPATPDATWDVGTAVAEVTLSIPLPVFRPFGRVGFGMAWHGDSNFQAPEMSQTTVFGWVFAGAIGFDIYLADWFAINVAVTAEILNMNRQTIDEPIMDPGMVRFTETGDAVGAQGRATAGIAFHF